MEALPAPAMLPRADDYATVDQTTGKYLMIVFEWDDNKATRNMREHRVSFKTGCYRLH
jgi:hypothetical protein